MWWSDELDKDGIVLGYIERCHVTLIDFGFARALSTADLSTDVGLGKVEKEGGMGMSSWVGTLQANDKDIISIDEALVDSSVRKQEKTRGRSPTRSENEIDESQSRTRVRDLSALGTRNYAAPEIMSGLRRVASFSKLSSSSPGESELETKRSLAACVSNYGMVADAFSGKHEVKATIL